MIYIMNGLEGVNTKSRTFLEKGDSLQLIKKIPNEVCHLILSDIPYGIGYDEWDVLHNNTNSSYMGASEAQKQSGKVFKHRGKPLNGWSKADKEISKEYYEWCCKWAIEWLRVLKPGASVFIFAGRRMAHRCICALEDNGFIFKDILSWEKESAFHRAQRVSVIYEKRGDIENAEKWKGWRLGNLRPLFEPILWFMKPYPIGGTLADNIKDYEVGAYNDLEWKKVSSSSSNLIKVTSDKEDHGLHPTQKPVSLLEHLITLTTIEGQVVLDPFMGSGSTGIACKNLNRVFIGFEANDQYFDVASKRLRVD